MEAVMKTLITRLLLIALALLTCIGTASAQQPPPTITSFTSDLPSITLDAAEDGQTTATLSWRSVGLTEAYHLALDTYSNRQWIPLVDTSSTPLPADGLYIARVLHLCGFCAPTYRLSIVDTRSQIIDQKILFIPLADDKAKPVISAFTTGVQGVEANSLAQRSARVTVFWQITHRTPNSNLVFEQVLEDGSVVNVELPRADLWIPSNGQGEVAPTLPQRNSVIQIRMRVVDVLDGTVYDEKNVTVPVMGTVTAPVINTVAAPPVTIVGSSETAGGTVLDTTNTPPPQILYFGVTPNVVDRGGTVTISWNVLNARSLMIARLNPLGQFADFYPVPQSSGNWTVTLPTYYVDSASFQLVAIGAQDAQTYGTATAQVLCPYTYFFGNDPQGGCPLSGQIEVEAVFQPFERGVMMRRGDTRQIYVLYNDGQRAGIWNDTFVPGEPVDILTEPPAGLYKPTEGFGKLWLQSVDTMNGLGWATGPALAYTMRVQQSGQFISARTYLAWPDGKVVYTADDRWAFIVP
jgi:hypothetical protein